MTSRVIVNVRGLSVFFRNIVKSILVPATPRMILTASFNVMPLTGLSSSFITRSPDFKPTL